MRIIEASCDNCRYVFYNTGDKEEKQKCRVLIMKIKPPINEEALEKITKSEEGADFCDYYSPIERLKERIYFP